MIDSHTGDRLSIRMHKRQRTWQILVPFFVMLALIIAAAAFLLVGTTADPHLWANISIIWLLAPLLFFALFGLVIFILLIYALARLTRLIPRYSEKAQHFFMLVNLGSRRTTDLIARPVLWTHQAGAAIRSVFKR